MKRRTVFGTMAALAVAVLALLTFSPNAYADSPITVGTLTCNNVSGSFYPKGGHLIDCTSGTLDTTHAALISDVYGTVTSSRMTTYPASPKTSNYGQLSNEGVTFYIFDDVNQWLNSGLAGVGDEESGVYYTGWSDNGVYSATFAAWDRVGDSLPTGPIPDSQVEAATRHEIGHQLTYVYDPTGSNLTKFNNLVGQDTTNMGTNQCTAGSRLFYDLLDYQGLVICDSHGWENGYGSYSNSLQVLQAAYPYFFTTSVNSIYIELEAEEYAWAQGGTGPATALYSIASSDGFKCSADVYILDYFQTGAAPTTYSGTGCTAP